MGLKCIKYWIVHIVETLLKLCMFTTASFIGKARLPGTEEVNKHVSSKMAPFFVSKITDFSYFRFRYLKSNLTGLFPYSSGIIYFWESKKTSIKWMAATFVISPCHFFVSKIANFSHLEFRYSKSDFTGLFPYVSSITYFFVSKKTNI